MHGKTAPRLWLALANNCDPKTKQDIRQIVYFRDMKKTILAIALLVTAMSLSQLISGTLNHFGSKQI